LKTKHQSLTHRDPIDQIRRFDRGLNPADRSCKHSKMAVSAFSFFRGTNHLFWSDLGRDRRLGRFSNNQTRTWIQGDLHAENFGAYKNAADQIAYSINDFDESIVADYQYDLWRMATSLAIIARDNAIKPKHWGKLIDAFTLAYLSEIAALVGNDRETQIFFTVENTYGKLDNFLREVENENSRERMLDQWTTRVQRSLRFNLDNDKLQAVSEEERSAILAALPDYGKTLAGQLNYSKTHFQAIDIARRVNAGTGSLGTPRYYVLIAGRNAGDRRILDLKLQTKPSAYSYIRKSERHHYDTHFANDAERHAIAYRATTLHTDDYLGWISLADGVYSVRERSPHKATFDTTTLRKPKSLRKLCEQWGKILATCHARADHNYDAEIVPHSFEDEVQAIVQGFEPQFCQLVRDVALSYADVVFSDWQAFLASDLCN
jgi:uncharacterized protein (DUF2252 family)